VAIKAAPAPACIRTSTKNGGGSSSTTTKCSNGSTGGRSSVAHAGATAPGLIRCTNPHIVAVIGTTASTHHPPPGGVRGKQARGAWGLGGPSLARPPQQPATNPCYSQLSQGLAVPLQSNVCGSEGIGPRKERAGGRGPSLTPPARNHHRWWGVGSTPPFWYLVGSTHQSFLMSQGIASSCL
jgi:hypothetical protein